MKIYRCNICGKTITVLNDKDTPTICCNKETEPITPKEKDSIIGENHEPRVTLLYDKVYVRVGEKLHPNIKEHQIQWILLETDDGYQIKYIKPADDPITSFKLSRTSRPLTVYSYCNLHGLWKKDITSH